MRDNLWQHGTPHYEPPSARGFTIPPDVIAALGEGDHVAGYAVLQSMFDHHPMHGPHLDTETVKEIGHGDLRAGRKVLHKFIAKVRMRRARDAKARSR